MIVARGSHPPIFFFILGPQKWFFLDSEQKFPIISRPNVVSISPRGLQISLPEENEMVKLDKLMLVQYITYLSTASDTVAL